jgi:hypothetical protein
MKPTIAAMIGVALVVGACQSATPTPAGLSPAPAAATLPPGRLAVLRPGTTFVFRNGDGEETTSSVIAVDGGDVTWQASNGWTWTGKTFYWPVERWRSETEDSAGAQVVTGDAEALFPMTVGERVAYRYEGRSRDARAGWTGQGRCEVAASERITVPAGVFDTYKVVCEQGEDLSEPYRTRTWWYAPALGHYVATRHQTRDGALDELEQLVTYRAG